jgi:hypothetical protein
MVKLGRMSTVNLIWFFDLLVSSGGTMNREAAVLAARIENGTQLWERCMFVKIGFATCTKGIDLIRAIP